MAGWKWFGALHTKLYRATRGKLGARLVGMPVLLLTTTGRHSRQPRTAPMPYLAWDESWVIVGSNNGAARDPAWWFNLQSDPEAQIELGAKTVAVRARAAEPRERAELWPLLIDFNPRYIHYRKMTERELPVVILSPREQGAEAPC